jgi:hypothetical protein
LQQIISHNKMNQLVLTPPNPFEIMNEPSLLSIGNLVVDRIASPGKKCHEGGEA